MFESATGTVLTKLNRFKHNRQKWLSHNNFSYEKYFNNDDKANKSGLSGPCCVAYHC